MAPMRPHQRAASIREQLDRILGDPMNPLAPPVSSDPPANASTPKPAPAEKKKKPRVRSTAVTDAKNILRAATAVTSKSLAAPRFVHHPPDIARHRRKCAVCHHPDREAIEDLFIHWHSPEAIASHYEEDDESITWISIYRHAYAFGLDEIRRRNLRFVFEHILDQAGTTAATPASIIVAARALGSCVNANGDWNEPPKRVLVTNIIRNESPQTASTPASGAEIEPEQSSSRASFPRDVFPPAGEDSVPSSAPPAFVDADRPHRLAPPEINDNPSSDAETDIALANASEEPEVDERSSAFRAPHPRDVVDPVPASLPPGFSASSDIRNSLNPFNFKEPPISNR